MSNFERWFRGWLAKYPYTDYDQLNLDWIIRHVDDAIELAKETATDQVNLRKYVDEYFSQLSVPDEVKKVIDDMKADGYFSELLDDIVDDRLNDITETVGELSEAVTENEGDISGLDTRLTNAERAIAKINRPQKLALIGDSYTVDSMTPNFTANMAANGITFDTGHKYTVGGTGCWDNSWKNAINGWTADSDITDVVVMSCYNDWYNQVSSEQVQPATLQANVKAFRDAVHAKCPNANILVYFCGNNLSPAAAGRFERRTKYLAYNAYAANQNEYFKIVSGSWSILLNVNDVQSDGLHPTASGSALMCRLIAESIKAHGAPIERHQTAVESELGISAPSNMNRYEVDWIQQSINGSDVSMHMEKLYCEWNNYNQQAWQPDQQAVNALEVLDVATPLVCGSLYPWSFNGTTSCVIQDWEGNFYEAACNIIMLQDKIYLRHSNVDIPKNAFVKNVLVENVTLRGNTFDVTT